MIVMSARVGTALDWQHLMTVQRWAKRAGNVVRAAHPGSGHHHLHHCAWQCRPLAQVHNSLLSEFKYALVWGLSSKHYPQRCGLSHRLADEDVVQIVKKKVKTDDEGRGRFKATGAWGGCCGYCGVVLGLLSGWLNELH